MTRFIPQKAQENVVEFLDYLIALDDPDTYSVGATERRTITLTKIISMAEMVRSMIGDKVDLPPNLTNPLAEIRERLDGATPGPWELREQGGQDLEVHSTANVPQSFVALLGDPAFISTVSDALFVANAPEDIRFLLEEVGTLVAMLSTQKGQAREALDLYREVREVAEELKTLREQERIVYETAIEHQRQEIARLTAKLDALEGDS